MFETQNADGSRSRVALHYPFFPEFSRRTSDARIASRWARALLRSSVKQLMHLWPACGLRLFFGFFDSFPWRNIAECRPRECASHEPDESSTGPGSRSTRPRGGCKKAENHANLVTWPLDLPWRLCAPWPAQRAHPHRGPRHQPCPARTWLTIPRAAGRAWDCPERRVPCT